MQTYEELHLSDLYHDARAQFNKKNSSSLELHKASLDIQRVRAHGSPIRSAADEQCAIMAAGVFIWHALVQQLDTPDD